jgi:tetratricopeptide (TPR) repeat protein
VNELSEQAAANQVDSLIRAHRYGEAKRLLDDAIAGYPGGCWRLQLRKAELELLTNASALPEIALALESLRDHPASLPREEQVRFCARLVQVYITMRCFGLASDHEQTCVAALGDDPLFDIRRGEHALALDQREDALACFRKAGQLAPQSGEVVYSLAHVHFVRGEFSAAAMWAERTPTSSYWWLHSQRLLASIAAVRREHEQEIAAWKRILRRHGDGDNAPRDRVALALALTAAGHLSGAREIFRQVWVQDPQGQTGLYARARLEVLEASTSTSASRRMIDGFPTTAQKRHLCGPAVIELSLRYLGLEADSEEIARDVQAERGTLMREIVRYLERRKVVARRIEATAERLKKAVQLGYPVIVQEEYSTSAHVAVIIGYDDRLGLFIAQDPTSHRPLLKSVDWVAQAGDLFGNGGVLVLGSYEERAMHEAIADDAGLVEAKHLILLDERERKQPGSNAPLASEEIVRLCERALGLAPSFRLAWYERARAHVRSWRVHRGERHRQAALEALYDVRSRYPDDGWSYHLQGHVLESEQRFDEAYVAYLAAWRFDEGDGRALSAMGRCMLLAGDLKRAESCWERTLEIEPTDRGAIRGLAGLYLQQMDTLRRAGIRPSAAAAGAPDDAERCSPSALMALASIASNEPHSPLARTVDDVARRAEHYCRLALGRTPEDPYAWSLQGMLELYRVGDRRLGLVRAREAFEKAAELGGLTDWSVVGFAAALEGLGDTTFAEQVLEAGCEHLRNAARPWLALALLRARYGSAAKAASTLARALELVEDDRIGVATAYYQYASGSGTPDEAAVELRRYAERHRNDTLLLRALAQLFETHGQRSHAIALFRTLCSIAPRDVKALFRLGRLLGKSLATREEAKALLSRIVQLTPPAASTTSGLNLAGSLINSPTQGRERPWADSARVLLAWLYLSEERPQRGLEVLRDCSEQNPHVWATRAALHRYFGRESLAKEAEHHALTCAGDRLSGRIELVGWHLEEGRPRQAYRLASEIELERVPKDRRRESELVWIAAHRAAGRVADVVDQVRALWHDRLLPTDPRFAEEVARATRLHDPELSALASRELMVLRPAEALLWRIRVAGCEARCGNDSELRALRNSVEGDVAGWVALAEELHRCQRHDEGAAAAARAAEIAPNDRKVLAARESSFHYLGQPEKALRTARELVKRHPFEQSGAERLGLLLARLGQVEEALDYSAQAVDAAPHRPLAHGSRAVACFMASDYESARSHASQWAALAPRGEEEGDAHLVLRALDGDSQGLERGLARFEERVLEAYPLFVRKLRDVVRSRVARQSIDDR